jgi:hypothetical protein
MRGLFPDWQLTYAVRGVPTFPVEIVDAHRKKPRVRVTIGDVDERGDEFLYAGLEMWGDTPLIVKTANGKYHCYYRNGGKKRLIRPLGKHKPYDVLGDGFVVAAPSLGPGGQYQIIRGSVDDLYRLPPMRQLLVRPQTIDSSPRTVEKPWGEMVEGDGRNHHLWYFLMGQAHGMSLNEIAAIADDHNRRLKEPMAEAEVSKIVQSVLEYERNGMHFVGIGKAMLLFHDLYDRLEDHVDALSLFLRLKRVHWHRDQFALSTAMAKELRWGWSRFKAATVTLVTQEIIACMDEGGRGPYNPPTQPDIGTQRRSMAQGLDSNLVARTWCCRIGRGLGRRTHFFACRWS